MVVNKGPLVLFILLTCLIISSQAFSQELKMLDTVDELIAAASEGGSYQLAAGRYELEDTLLIQDDFSLFGAGMKQTTIVPKAELIGVSVQGDISVVFEGITFKHEGNLQEDVVEIQDAQFLIRSCKFTGGVWQEVAEDAEFVYGSGLWLHGKAEGEIHDSEFVDNDANGINISGEVELRLEQSSISNNGWAGILALDQSRVFANKLFLVDNEEEGLAFSSDGYLRLSNGVIETNQGGGVWLYGDSSADITDNLFRENKTFAALGMNQTTNVRVRGNSFYNHEVASIYAYGNATARLIENHIQANKTGIAVADEAKVQISENMILSNIDAINLFDTASAMIMNNTFNEVIEDGINLHDASYASIKGNEFIGEGLATLDTENDLEVEAMISSYDEASSYVAENIFDYSDVSFAHVYLDDMSHSTIVDNVFGNNNANPAIDVSGEARATIRDNVINGNAYGIVARSTGVATVSSNIFEDNNYAILAYGQAKVFASDNIMDYGLNSTVALREESQLWLRDSSIHYAGDAAIDARGSSRAGLFNNDFSYSESFGIYSVDKSAIYANKNYLGDNYSSGVYTTDNSNVAIVDNVFENHFEYALQFAGKTNADAAFNYFSNNNVALGFQESAALSLIENEFQDNGINISRIK